MRTTVVLDDALLDEAQHLTGVIEKSALLRLALTALVQREAAHRLALLGGSDQAAAASPRRRPRAA